MNAEQWSNLGAAALAVGAVAAAVTVYVVLGLDRPAGRRVRQAMFAFLLVTAGGFLLVWLMEARASSTSEEYTEAATRLAMAVALIAVAIAVWQERAVHHADE
jgi:uncharacterized membrane protein (DUF4010 family)